MNIVNTIAISTVFLLTGCGTLGQAVADMYNSADHCQLKNNGGRVPSYCGASAGRVTVYETQHGQPLGTPRYYIKK